MLRDQKIDIVITDNAMPGMTGLQFLRVVRQRHPQVVRIMLSGQATLATAIAAINQGEIFRFIEKPWDDQELNFMLLQACDRIRQGAQTSSS